MMMIAIEPDESEPRAARVRKIQKNTEKYRKIQKNTEHSKRGIMAKGHPPPSFQRRIPTAHIIELNMAINIDIDAQNIIQNICFPMRTREIKFLRLIFKLLKRSV